MAPTTPLMTEIPTTKAIKPRRRQGFKPPVDTLFGRVASLSASGISSIERLQRGHSRRPLAGFSEI